MIEHFSTRQVEAASKVDYWNALVGQTHDGLVVDPLQPQFHANLWRWTLDELVLVRPRSQGAVIARRRGGTATHLKQKLAIHIVQSGDILLTHRDRQLVARSGDMVVCASEEYYRFDVQGPHDLLVVELDRDKIAGCVPNIDDIVGQRYSGALPTTRMLTDFMLSLWREGTSGFAGDYGADYANMLTSLIATSLKCPEGKRHEPPSSIYENLKKLVRNRFADPALSPSILAAEIGVSLRSLQLATSKFGETPIDHISRVRLEVAAQLLQANPTRSVADIGFECGFADHAYFSRRFARRYGCSPKHFRQRH